MATLPNKRLLSLDVFRGVTIATMIFVNTLLVTPFPILGHSDWNGCTLADIVFPFFVFVIGVSVVFSLSKQLKNHTPKSILYGKIIKRTLIIIGLGLLLNAFPHHLNSETIGTIRFYGVLQRIAVCYGAAALAYLTLSTRLQVLLTTSLLVGYWLIMTYFPLETYGAGDLSPEGNVAANMDRWLFSATHLYGKVFDPEGLLSTMPAIATALLGNLTGIGLLTSASPYKKYHNMVLAATVLAVLGWVWGLWFPINKALWTSSYVLWTGGLALYCLSACYWLLDIKHYHRWSKPFEIFGLNAIVAYFFHVLFFKIQLMIHLSCDQGTTCNMYNYIIRHCFGWVALPYASLLYALSSVLFWLLILSILYKNKIFIRI